MSRSIMAGTDEVRGAALAFLKDPERRLHWRSFYNLAYRAPPVDLGRGEWLLAGWHDVIAAMKSSGSELSALYPVTRHPSVNALILGMLPYEQGRDHHRLRALASPLFTPSALARLTGRLESLLDELLFPAIFESQGSSILSTLGTRVPEAISSWLLDADPRDQADLGNWSRRMYAQMGRYNQSPAELDEIEGVFQAFHDYVRRRMKGEGTVPCGGVGEALIAAWGGGELDDAQLQSYFALFLLTGLDTLTYSICNSLWFLGNAPEVFAVLQASPERVDVAFDEAMRLWGPIRLCVRHLLNEVSVTSGVLPAGSLAFLVIHAANRDPARFEQPDSLLWNRRKGEELAFGVGAHGCLGTALGKLVGRSLYRLLAARCESLRVSPGADDPRFIPSLPILGIESVRLFAEPRRQSAHAIGRPRC